MLDTKKLAHLMERKPINATELADQVGVTRQTIYNLLNGRSQPKERTLLRISEVLGCEPETLIVAGGAHDSEHERFAEIVVQRFLRETTNYDISAAVMDHYYNWLTSEYGDLTDEEYQQKKDLSEFAAKEFAKDISLFIMLGDEYCVSEATLTEAAREAFSMTFDNVLPTMTVDVSDEELNGE